MKNFILATLAIPMVLFAISDNHIMVDQFGYLPNAPKHAVIREAHNGQFSPDNYTPADSLIVRKVSDSVEVFRNEVTVWNNGVIDTLSGDKGWWFDFSNLTTTGTYELFDPSNNTVSAPFEISNNVYDNLLKDAMRTYYYQRCGIEKAEPFAETPWIDNTPCHLQDTIAHFAFDTSNSNLKRNLSGGWHDAGDYNKYITFLPNVINPLLQAYQSNPYLWSDSTGIPESGNGVPDILDEINYELQWALSMQDTDGKVFLKLGTMNYSGGTPPSSHSNDRFYGHKSSASTITFAAFMAHAAFVFQDIPELTTEAEIYKTAAINAWNAFDITALDTALDNGEVKSGDADMNENAQKLMASAASMWLFASTGDEKYHTYFKDNYNVHNWWAGPYNLYSSQALLYYTTLTNADASTASDIIQDMRSASNGYYLFGFDPDSHLYRSFMPKPQWHWGSNSVQATMGVMNYQFAQYNVDETNRESYLTKALGSLNYLHGINPMGKVYLTAMNDRNAENSVTQLYHSWFADGSSWDSFEDSDGPAPAILVGGPNKNYTGTVAPPAGEPPEKSYADINGTDWQNEITWEITENSITYQAPYINLLSLIIAEYADTGTTAIDKPDHLAYATTKKIKVSSTGKSITIKGMSSEKALIKITDLRGRVVFKKDVQGKAGKLIVLKKQNLATGSYLLSIKTKTMNSCLHLNIF